MKASRHTRLMKWMAVVGAGAAIAAASAQAGGPRRPIRVWARRPTLHRAEHRGKAAGRRAQAKACTAAVRELWRRCAGARSPRGTPS